MTTPSRRLGGLLTAAALLGAPAAVSPLGAVGAEAASHAGACRKGEGVTVVVQDPHRTITRCGIGDPATGAAALTRAGFRIDYREKGFVCRIGYGGVWYPGGALTDNRQCAKLANGRYTSWTYWHALNPSRPWTYSSSGLLKRNPPLNSIEGWRWGNGTQKPRNGSVPGYSRMAGGLGLGAQLV